MDKLTYITTYYNEPELLERLLQQITEYNNPNLYLIVVDDASSTYPAKDVVAKYLNDNITLYRVKTDIGFNSHGARNLAMQETKTEWNILIDIDYKLNNIDALFEQLEELEKDAVHVFPVAHSYKGNTSAHRESINDFLITKTLYWKAEGYDSELFGFHIGDREFLAKVFELSRFQHSVLFDCKLEALRSPFAKMVVDDSAKEFVGEYFRDYENGRMVITEERLKKANEAMAAMYVRRKSNDKNIPITFDWELVNFNVTEEENDNEER